MVLVKHAKLLYTPLPLRGSNRASGWVRWETNGTEQPGGENEVFLLSMETSFGFIMGEVRASLEMEGKCVCVLLLRVGNVN